MKQVRDFLNNRNFSKITWDKMIIQVDPVFHSHAQGSKQLKVNLIDQVLLDSEMTLVPADLL